MSEPIATIPTAEVMRQITAQSQAAAAATLTEWINSVKRAAKDGELRANIIVNKAGTPGYNEAVAQFERWGYGVRHYKAGWCSGGREHVVISWYAASPKKSGWFC